MKLKYFLSLLLLMVATLLWAQDKEADSTKNARSLLMMADVKDHLTHDPIKGVKAELLWAADSSFVDTIHSEYQDEEYYKNSSLSFPVTKAGDYLIKIGAEGYTT